MRLLPEPQKAFDHCLNSKDFLVKFLWKLILGEDLSTPKHSHMWKCSEKVPAMIQTPSDGSRNSRSEGCEGPPRCDISANKEWLTFLTEGVETWGLHQRVHVCSVPLRIWIQKEKHCLIILQHSARWSAQTAHTHTHTHTHGIQQSVLNRKMQQHIEKKHIERQRSRNTHTTHRIKYKWRGK